jgi:hypothetical protein
MLNDLVISTHTHLTRLQNCSSHVKQAHINDAHVLFTEALHLFEQMTGEEHPLASEPS